MILNRSLICLSCQIQILKKSIYKIKILLLLIIIGRILVFKLIVGKQLKVKLLQRDLQKISNWKAWKKHLKIKKKSKIMFKIKNSKVRK